MRAISIDPNNQSLKEIDIIMEANTVFSFFNSILIDYITTLKEHTIHTDANALSESKKAFFIGERLLIGDALITGVAQENDVDTTIPIDTLQELISYDLPKFYQDTLSLLARTDINLYRPFVVTKDGEKINVTTEWVLYTFNIADDTTKEYFLSELTKSLNSTQEAESFIQKIAQLALNAV